MKPVKLGEGPESDFELMPSEARTFLRERVESRRRVSKACKRYDKGVLQTTNFPCGGR